MKNIVCLAFMVLLFGCDSFTAKARVDATAAFYQSLLESSPQDHSNLALFLNQMPKGGDLHIHYSGTIYAETYLKWVARKGWRINACTLLIDKTAKQGTADCPLLTVEKLRQDPSLHRKLLTLWSSMSYQQHNYRQNAPDLNFFNTFFYFGGVSDEYMAEGLQTIKQRAKDENVAYIEMMINRTGARATNYFTTKEYRNLNRALRQGEDAVTIHALLDSVADKLLNNADFNKRVQQLIDDVNRDHQDIDDDDFTMRYQSYAIRVQKPLQVFLDLLAGYLATERSPLFVGVNIVAPEHSQVALDDYTLHMHMYSFLAKHYPQVGRSLHAGELTLGLVPPQLLTFHINQAVNIAQAQRIGHGIDVVYERQPFALLEKLKRNDIAIEINLQSNEFILGVKGADHPYHTYRNFGVPMVISTDDSGVSRDNLSHQYLLLATRYKPTYADLKKHVYNSIRYAFLEDAEKQRISALLDRQFARFESNVASWASGSSE